MSVESICFPRLLLLSFATNQTLNRSSAAFAQVTRGPARVSAGYCGLVASYGQADVEVVIELLAEHNT